ncbi:MAG: hypothetical protein IJW32_04185 [Clostridia bacterium]|nr:hypothetical protein [Candidatus Gastranaerophilales bacterium]MBQ9792920.1 hypothetical protein [Clostridia bacterium]
MLDRINTAVINTRQAEKNRNRNNQSFKGVGTAALVGLKSLNDSPAIGACAVDLASMVIPRTTIEMKNRGPQAGIEAAFREGTSCLIHACVGLIGLGAATLLSGKFNKTHGIKAQNIFASGDTINNMSQIWQSSEGQKQFFDGFVQSIKGLNGTEWKRVSEGAKDDIVEGLVYLAEKSDILSKAKGADKAKLSKEVKILKNTVLSKVTKDTGAQASFKMNAGQGVKDVSASLGELVDNAVSLSNAFKTKSKDKLPDFVKALKGNKVASTLLGMGICAAMCISVQPINRFLTKKRTGSDGFVGVEGKGGDNSKGFKAAKTVAGIAFPIFSLKTIGKMSDLVSNIQFNSKVPTINQFKFLYGFTIGSRFLSSRDSNELRESVIKDTLGYTNWLILGGMVSKLTARALGGKELINNPVAQEGKKGLGYAFKWLSKASVKSFDEVLLPAAKEIAENGKPLKFTKLLEKADGATKSKIAKIAVSQVAGYLYSGIVLGVGISKLNIFITKKFQEKKNKQANQNVQPKLDLTDIAKIQTQKSTVFKDFN